MAHANTDPRHEALKVDGHVVDCGCQYRPDLQRWEPLVSIRPAWDAGHEIHVTAPPQNFQDTPEDAMAVARTMASDWSKANPAPTS